MSEMRYHEALSDFAAALGQAPLAVLDAKSATPQALRELVQQLVAEVDAEMGAALAAHLAMAVAHVAALRAVTSQVLPALAELQRAAHHRFLETNLAEAAQLGAALDLSGQMLRNCLSLLKELPLGPWPQPRAEALLWGLALHAQTRCTRGHVALAADGHALANLASSLQMIDRTLQRHRLGRPLEALDRAEALLAQYAQAQALDGVEAGLLVMRACGDLAEWLQRCAQGGENA